MASALYAEGPTDHRFLRGLIPRSITALGAEFGVDLVEAGPLRQLSIRELGDSTRAEKVAAAVNADGAAFHVLFIHADADGDAERARRERVAPAVEAVFAELGSSAGREQVAVVPIQMTEAWALADLEALRNVLSTGLDHQGLGIPSDPGELEAASDPKDLLDAVVQAARPGRAGRRRPKGSVFLEVLGESVSIDALRRLAGYRIFETELHAALARLGHLYEPSTN